MMAAAIEATKTVIDTLGPSDAIQVIDFDSDAVTTTETCMTTMVPATDDNKKKLKAFVGRMKAGGSTGFDSLLRAALRLDRGLACVLLCCGALTQHSGT